MNITDAETDDFGLRMSILVFFDATGDFAEEVVAGELGIRIVDTGHICDLP